MALTSAFHAEPGSIDILLACLAKVSFVLAFVTLGEPFCNISYRAVQYAIADLAHITANFTWKFFIVHEL